MSDWSIRAHQMATALYGSKGLLTVFSQSLGQNNLLVPTVSIAFYDHRTSCSIEPGLLTFPGNS
jgi:hypothetical protein